jgi:acyl-CoA thioesterase-1
MKKFLIALLASLFTLPVFAQNTILIVGDSLSAGYGIDPKQGWVALLESRLKQNKLDYQVVNASISGDTTSNGLARLPAALHQHKPAVTIIELGANDGLRGIQLPLIKSNLLKMIDLVRQTGSRVLILGIRLPPNYGPQYTTQFENIYRELAGDRSITVVPQFLKEVDENPELRQPDGLHPTLSAQTILLNNVWPTLLTLLK